MSKHKSISVVDTAKLIRLSLKEAFAEVKFNVRCSKYAGGASIHVGWVDGPSTLQVETLTRRFASCYYDAAADYWAPLWHRIDGELVHFGAGHVSCHRAHSDDWCASAIGEVYAQHQNLLRERGIEKPSVRDFFEGRLHSIPLMPVSEQADESDDIPFGDGTNRAPYKSMLDAVVELLDQRSSCAAPAISTTALAVTLDPGDNRAGALNGAGWARELH